MSEFNFFYNDWVDYDPLFESKIDDSMIILDTKLNANFFKELCLDRHSLKKYRIKAAELCAKTLGNKPALCISGGVDSQAMLQCWIEAKLDFDVYILKFLNDLNIQDVAHARLISKKFKIKLHEIPIDIINFLNRENFDYGEKYKSASPHFNVHYKLFDILRNLNYTGLACGGQTVLCNNDIWGSNFTRNPFNFINYSQITTFPVQGSFLSFYPELSWAISLLTKKSNSDLSTNIGYHVDDLEKERYGNKINGYIRSGFAIIPQPRKFTGFELVKKYYESLTNDVWEFEKRFRIPLSNLLQIIPGATKFNLSKDRIEDIENLYTTHMSESLLISKFFEIKNSFGTNESYIDNVRPWQ